jgi:hypothetical protein
MVERNKGLENFRPLTHIKGERWQMKKLTKIYYPEWMGKRAYRPC